MLLNSSPTFVCIHDTEFPASKPTATQPELSTPHRLRFVLLWLALLLSLQLCSCAKLPRHSPSAESSGNSPGLSNKMPPATRVNLNTAAKEEFDKLPVIGKVMAERIGAHRKHFGPCRRVEHLMMVQGFSDHKFRAIRDLVTVE